jgi:4-azaleucine resistance transporter AzlC
VLSPAFLRGARVLVPAMPGIVAFGVITGVAAVAAGLSPASAIAMSVIGYAGSAQLVAIQLLQTGSPVLVIALAALIVNLRFVLYSLAVGPSVRGRSLGERWLMSYLLSDNGYAHTATRFAERPDDSTNWDFLLGNCVACWVCWESGTLLGVLAGAAVPAAWGLEFVVALTFLALGIGTIANRATAAAYLTGGVVAVAANALPFRLGLIAGAFAGIAAGLAFEHWANGRGREASRP